MKAGNLGTALRWAEHSAGEQRRMRGVLLPAGRRLGVYVVEDLIGSGGFGNVYRARHATIGNEVALKVLHRERCEDASSISRFIDEARAANAIDHPGIVEIFDFGVTDDCTHFFAMELLRGRSLAEVLVERGHLPLSEAKPLLRQLAAIVDAIHVAGVSHRDLKPANVMILGDGSVRLVDFGLAKLAVDVDRTRTQEPLGTPLYMAPEQARGIGADASSDRYSFGALAYHVLTGTPPFVGEPIAVAVAHVETTPTRPSRVRRALSHSVDLALLSLLDKKPSARPKTLVPLVDAMRPKSFAVSVVTGCVATSVAVAAVVMHTGGAALPTIAAGEFRVVRSLDVPDWNRVSIRPNGDAVDFYNAVGSTVTWDGQITSREALYRSDFSDGSFVESESTVLFRTKDGKTQPLGAGMSAEACSTGRYIAALTRGKLVVNDLETHVQSVVAVPESSWGIRWSPDCTRIVWANHVGVFVTDVARKTSQQVPIEISSVNQFYAPVAFVDRDALVYCGTNDGDDATLQVHYLDRRAPDTKLLDLHTTATACSIAASRDGKHLVVMGMAHSVTAQLVDVSTRNRTTLASDTDGGLRVLGMLDDEHAVVGRYPLTASRIVSPSKTESAVRPRWLDVIDKAGNKVAVPPGCRSALGIVTYRGRPAYAVLSDDASHYRFLDTSFCTEVANLPLPAAGTWSVPSCVSDTCITAVIDGDALVISELIPTRRELGRVRLGSTLRDTAPSASAALSPDRRHVVMLRESDPGYYTLDVQTGAVESFPLGDVPRNTVNGTTWLDSQSFVLQTDLNFYDRFDLTGKHARIGAASLYFPGSPSGRTLTVGMEQRHSKLFLLERK